MFGPQTHDAALLEVETMPILAKPLNGVDKETGDPVKKLDNADETHGNMIVMTNTGDLSGLQMARIAMNSGAAALLVVNMDEKHPDDIYRLTMGNTTMEEDVSVDIPVVMISLNSANVLTTATVTADMAKEDIVNNGMPDRVRLYAGADRPFFEEIEPVNPTIYLIHNLLTEEECEALISKVSSGSTDDKEGLLLSHDISKQEGIDKAVIWKGALHSYAGKQVEERCEQVTGFPANHYSDFVVMKLEKGSLWQPHYDILLSGEVPMATITVFLGTGGDDEWWSPQTPAIVYPSLKSSDPVKILPQQGMAIVHHNLDDRKHELDVETLSAWMPNENDGPVYIAQKFVFVTPPSVARRIVLPFLAAPFGGKLPAIIYKIHELMVTKFGNESGNVYFDKLCVFVPLLIILSAAQAIANYVQANMKTSSSTKSKSSDEQAANSKTSKSKKRTKRE